MIKKEFVENKIVKHQWFLYGTTQGIYNTKDKNVLWDEKRGAYLIYNCLYVNVSVQVNKFTEIILVKFYYTDL
jgi:hypothetical protein